MSGCDESVIFFFFDGKRRERVSVEDYEDRLGERGKCDQGEGFEGKERLWFGGENDGRCRGRRLLTYEGKNEPTKRQAGRGREHELTLTLHARTQVTGEKAF